jgi:hypothetical protein
VVAELVYHGTSLAEIAGLSWLQIRWLYFRDRDEHCMLVRPRGKGEYKAASVEGGGRQFTKGWWKELVRSASKRMVGKRFDLPDSVPGMRHGVWVGLTEEQVEQEWKAYVARKSGDPTGWLALLYGGKPSTPRFKPSKHQFKPINGNGSSVPSSQE